MKYLFFLGMVLPLLLVGCTSNRSSTSDSSESSKPIVRIHYLGHASFFIQFDNGVSVLTDYGQSNAYGLNSPIYDLIDIEPSVVTFSHAHPDHKRADVEFGQAYVLTNTDDLSLQGLDITPIRTCEASTNKADNTSFLFTYKGIKILHLADAQAYITSIEKDSIKQRVKELYPDTYDVLLMTIEGVNQFIPQAELFIDIIQPVYVIPMHYWSPEYKAEFLAYLEEQNQQAGRDYIINEDGGPVFEFPSEEKPDSIQVVNLEPAALSGK
jgi:L-ascorbate metabolism protein UlaG (beta-lactamase superfamily)